MAHSESQSREKRKTAMFAEWLNKAVCYGAGNGTRTHDLRITNALLYQLSYTSKILKRTCNIPARMI